MKNILLQFLVGAGACRICIVQLSFRRSLCRLVALVLLCATLPTPAWCQLAMPEFFGFYASDGGRTVALYEGKDSGGSKISQSLYSIPHDRTQAYTVPVVSPSVRFLLFYSNAGEMIKSMTFYRLPFVRNVIEKPELNQMAMGTLSGTPVNPRVIGTPNGPLLARIPELEARILTKPVPSQLEMVELVPDTTLVPGLYVFDYRPAGNQGWHAVLSIRASEQEKPYCMDLILPGGYDGLFERANSELNDVVPALKSYRYKKCDSPAAPPTVPRAGAAASDPVVAGQEFLSSGRMNEAVTAWDRALKSGARLKLSVCRERGLGCNRGTLQLGMTTVLMADTKGQAIFSASPREIESVGFSENYGFTTQAAYVRLRSGGKNYKLFYLPVGMECDFTSVPVCGEDGYAQQKVVAAYIASAIGRIASGELKLEPAEVANPDK